MWEKCVSCGEGLFAGDAFCGNCGRPTTSTVPLARELASGPFTRPVSTPEPPAPVPAGEPDGPPQLELGLGLVPGLGEPAGPVPALDGLADPAPALGGLADPVPALGGLADRAPALGGPVDAAPVAADTLAAPRPARAADDRFPGPGSQPARATDDGLPGTGRQPGPAADAGVPGPGGPAGVAVDPVLASGPLASAPEAAGHAGLNGQAGPGAGIGMAGPGDAAAAGGPPEPEMLIIPARQVGGPAGPGGRLTVPAQRRGQPSQPDQPAGPAGRPPHRTRLTGQANLDPAANSRFLLRVLRQAGLFAGLYALIETVLLIVFLVLGFTTLSLHSALRLETASLWLVALALASLFWIIPVPALLGQWSVLVESSAEASRPAFEHIATALRDHDAPLDSLDVRAVSPPHEHVRDYLEVRRGRFSGFISCFPHGRDLYVGWTFFLRMSPARLVLVCAGRSAAHLTRRGGDIRRALWFESARALVAAMHSATLAGIGAAVSAPDAAGQTGGSADDVVVKFG